MVGEFLINVFFNGLFSYCLIFYKLFLNGVNCFVFWWEKGGVGVMGRGIVIVVIVCINEFLRMWKMGMFLCLWGELCFFSRFVGIND